MPNCPKVPKTKKPENVKPPSQKKKKEFEQEDIDYVQTSDGEYPDEKTENIMFAWGIKGFGFGTTTFFYKDGKLMCDNETMSKDMIKTILCEFVDRAEFKDQEKQK